MPAIKRKVVASTKKAECLSKVAGGHAKRAKKEADPVSESIQFLKKAILNEHFKSNPETPMSVRGMLANALPEIFSRFQVDRHNFQTAMVELVRTHLDGVQVTLDGTLAQKNAVCETAASQREVLETAKESSKVEHEEKMRVEQELKECLETTESELATVLVTLKEATKKSVAVTKSQGAMVLKHTALKSLYEENFKVLQETGMGSKEAKKLYSLLEPQLKKMKIDASLLQAAPSALARSPETRGEFDILAVDTINSTFVSVFTENEQKEADAAAEVQTIDEAKVVAQSEVDAAKTKAEAAKEAFVTATADSKEHLRKFNESESAVQEHDQSTQQAQVDRVSAEKDLEFFGEVKKGFAFLDTRAEEKAEEPQLEENVDMNTDEPQVENVEAPQE